MNNLLTSLKIFLFATLLTGIVYPILIWAIGTIAFYSKINGDMVESNGKIVGAKLIGQKFESNRYFRGRPSWIDFDPLNSGGSNLGPSSLALREMVVTRRNDTEELFQSKNVPDELLFASGSGIDPHISVKTAYYQIDRIVKARNLDLVNGHEKLKQLIDDLSENHSFFYSNNPYVNVLQLNIALDKSSKRSF